MTYPTESLVWCEKAEKALLKMASEWYFRAGFSCKGITGSPVIAKGYNNFLKVAYPVRQNIVRYFAK